MVWAMKSFLLCLFFNQTAAAEIYTLSLHDALPIWRRRSCATSRSTSRPPGAGRASCEPTSPGRSEEHTSELQSHVNLVCRLLLEKKKPGQGLLGSEQVAVRLLDALGQEIVPVVTAV